MTGTFLSLFIALGFIILAIKPTGLFGQSTYIVKSVANGGAVTGKVSFSGTVQHPVQMDISQDNKSCGMSKPSPRLVLGARQGVANAIIFIEGISSGKPFPSGQYYLLDQHNCEYRPHVMIIPAGNKLEIVNSDAILHNVHSYETGPDHHTVFNIAQPVKEVKTSTKPLVKPGLLLATCDAGHPWMSAYIMVASHPYYTVTDENGNYRLDDVPPGTYTLHMWHEGFAIVKKEMEHGKVQRYEFEPPYEETISVDVPARSTVTADIRLTAR